MSLPSPDHSKDPAPQGNGEIPVLHPVPPGTAPHEDTGLPFLKTWPAVYAVVIGVFILWVLLLTLFMKSFS